MRLHQDLLRCPASSPVYKASRLKKSPLHLLQNNSSIPQSPAPPVKSEPDQTALPKHLSPAPAPPACNPTPDTVTPQTSPPDHTPQSPPPPVPPLTPKPPKSPSDLPASPHPHPPQAAVEILRASSAHPAIASRADTPSSAPASPAIFAPSSKAKSSHPPPPPESAQVQQFAQPSSPEIISPHRKHNLNPLLGFFQSPPRPKAQNSLRLRANQISQYC